MPASVDKLGKLHEAVTDTLIDLVGNAELVSAAELSVAVNFLKNNSITASVENNERLQALESQVQARRERRSQRRQAATEALSSADPVLVTPEAELAVQEAVLRNAEEMMQWQSVNH